LFFVQIVRLAAQGTADDLLTQELRAEGTDSQNVGDRIGIPSLGDHRDGYDATNGAAELPGLTDRVHDLAEKLLICDFVAGTGIAGPLYNFTAEVFNFVGSHAAKIFIERIARFELLAVDENRIRAGERISGDLVKIAEEREASVLQGGGTVIVFAMEAGDEIVDQL
jgi:hypothetical protein